MRKVQAGDASFAEAIDKALAEVKEYEAGISPVFEQIERAQIDGAVGGAYAEKYKKHMEASDKLLFDLAMDARKKMDEARQGVDALASTMSGMIGGALLLALAVRLIPLTFFSVRSITQSISQASELAERIAGGDLRVMQVTSSDEVGQLVGAMSRMQDALRGLVHQVQEAASNISTASSEIATGNHDLSQRTEQTAANLEEAASSMEVLTGTIQQSAQSSRQASDFASSAAQVAARGGACGVAGGDHHGPDYCQLAQDCRHHRRDRFDCLPDQHSGAQRGRGSRPRGEQAGFCRGGQRGA